MGCLAATSAGIRFQVKVITSVHKETVEEKDPTTLAFGPIFESKMLNRVKSFFFFSGCKS